jgi:hypothetical protein
MTDNQMTEPVVLPRLPGCRNDNTTSMATRNFTTVLAGILIFYLSRSRDRPSKRKAQYSQRPNVGLLRNLVDKSGRRDIIELTITTVGAAPRESNALSYRGTKGLGNFHALFQYHFPCGSPKTPAVGYLNYILTSAVLAA